MIERNKSTGNKDFLAKSADEIYTPFISKRSILDLEGVKNDSSRLITKREILKLEFDLNQTKELRALRTAFEVKETQFKNGPSVDIDNILQGRKVVNIVELASYYAMHLGGMLALAESRKEKKQKLKNLNTSKSINTYFALIDFLNLEGAELKIGTVSLVDIANQKKGNQLPVASILQYSMEVLLMNHRTKPADYVPDNDAFPERDYPNITAAKLYEVAYSFINTLVLLNTFSSQAFKKLAFRYPDYAKHAEGLLKQMNEFYKRFNTVFFNPDDRDFPQIKSMIERYVNIDQGINFLTIYFLARGSGESLQEFYRNVRNLQDHKVHGPFYKSLSESVVQYVEEIQPINEIRLHDDLPTFFSQQNELITPPISFDTLRRSTAAIFSKSSQLEYDIEPTLIEWQNLVPPQSVTVEFDQMKPAKFSIQLAYKSEEEDMNVEIYIDAKKETFNWNFLESPRDERMQPFAASLLQAIKSLLEEVDKQALIRQVNKRQDRERPETSTISKFPKVKPLPEETTLSKKRSKRLASDFSLTDLFQDPQAIEQIKKKIDVPDGFNNLVPHGFDPEKVIKRIHDFNESGVGKFKRLKTEDFFSFRIGDLRVLLKKQPSENPGEQHFTIFAIGNRRDIYKKLP